MYNILKHIWIACLIIFLVIAPIDSHAAIMFLIMSAVIMAILYIIVATHCQDCRKRITKDRKGYIVKGTVLCKDCLEKRFKNEKKEVPVQHSDTPHAKEYCDRCGKRFYAYSGRHHEDGQVICDECHNLKRLKTEHSEMYINYKKYMRAMENSISERVGRFAPEFIPSYHTLKELPPVEKALVEDELENILNKCGDDLRKTFAVKYFADKHNDDFEKEDSVRYYNLTQIKLDNFDKFKERCTETDKECIEHLFTFEISSHGYSAELVELYKNTADGSFCIERRSLYVVTIGPPIANNHEIVRDETAGFVPITEDAAKEIAAWKYLWLVKGGLMEIEYYKNDVDAVRKVLGI